MRLVHSSWFLRKRKRPAPEGERAGAVFDVSADASTLLLLRRSRKIGSRIGTTRRRICALTEHCEGTAVEAQACKCAYAVTECALLLNRKVCSDDPKGVFNGNWKTASGEGAGRESEGGSEGRVWRAHWRSQHRSRGESRTREGPPARRLWKIEGRVYAR